MAERGGLAQRFWHHLETPETAVTSPGGAGARLEESKVSWYRVVIIAGSKDQTWLAWPCAIKCGGTISDVAGSAIFACKNLMLSGVQLAARKVSRQEACGMTPLFLLGFPGPDLAALALRRSDAGRPAYGQRFAVCFPRQTMPRLLEN